MTGHLHTPILRLVSLNPLLFLNVSFMKVPEIHDGFKYKLFISRTTTVVELITSVVQELGLSKSLPIPGAGTLEYVLEEVWSDKATESALHFICLLIYHLNHLTQEFQDFQELLWYSMSWDSLSPQIPLNRLPVGSSGSASQMNGIGESHAVFPQL